jgi:CheY-like chemotaxis protein
MRVLVVDDSAAVRARLIALIDETSDANVDEAHDGKHALALAATLEPDLVVLDLHLVGATPGLEVLRVLKGRANPPVVVVLTNDASSHHRRECISLGAEHFFDKSKEFAHVADIVLEVERSRGLDGRAS